MLFLAMTPTGVPLAATASTSGITVALGVVLGLGLLLLVALLVVGLCARHPGYRPYDITRPECRLVVYTRVATGEETTEIVGSLPATGMPIEVSMPSRAVTATVDAASTPIVWVHVVPEAGPIIIVNQNDEQAVPETPGIAIARGTVVLPIASLPVGTYRAVNWYTARTLMTLEVVAGE